MKKVLVLIPYDLIYPPMNGGMQRCFHILHQLSLHFRVTAIINQDLESFNESFNEFPRLKQVKFFSTANRQKADLPFSLLPARIADAFQYRWYQRKLRGTTDSNFLLYYPLLKKNLKQGQPDIVFLENLDTMNAVDAIRRYAPQAKIVYDTHNVGYRLAEQELVKGFMKSWQVESIKSVESSFAIRLDAVLTCSRQELDDLKTINSNVLRGAVIPNGVQLGNKLCDEAVQQEHATAIIFCGSLGYEPNLEAIEWFYEKVWGLVKKEFTGLQWIIAGSGILPTSLQYILNDKNVFCTGTVKDIKLWYNKASVAIVPIQNGSGTRLKILEAMALGIPVVSTCKGAEGIEYRHHSNISIADKPDEFAYEIVQLLADIEKRCEIKGRALQLVKNRYDWNLIGRQLSDYLVDLVENNHPQHSLVTDD